MNNFSVYIKENGVYNEVNAMAVFPFSYGQLLDEQLDEAHIVIKLSYIKKYAPLTEIKIDIKKKNNGNVTVIESKYFVIAEDKSREFPIGAGAYTHELYLIERTKLLEGVACQSIVLQILDGQGTVLCP